MSAAARAAEEEEEVDDGVDVDVETETTPSALPLFSDDDAAALIADLLS